MPKPKAVQAVMNHFPIDKHWVRARNVAVPEGEKVFYHQIADWNKDGFWREGLQGLKDATLYSDAEKETVEKHYPGVHQAWFWVKRY